MTAQSRRSRADERSVIRRMEFLHITPCIRRKALRFSVLRDLLADAPGADTAAAQATDPQALLDYAQTLIEGEELMFTMDVPYVPAYDTPIVLAQAAAGSAPPTAVLNVCTETYHTIDPRSAFRAVDPVGMLQIYFQPTYNIDLSSIKITLLQGTQHGTLTEGVSTLGRVAYRYDPAPGYLGDDQAKFMAELELGGKHLRIMIIVQIKVLESVDERSPSCPDPFMIKAPKPATSDSGYSAGYNLASVSVNFADLAGGAVGQTASVGWVEQRDTHRFQLLGIAMLNPTYKVPISRGSLNDRT